MENQHRLITGYRELEQEHINRINTLKAMERNIVVLLNAYIERGVVDEQLARIAITIIQKGFMTACRSVARPEGYKS